MPEYQEYEAIYNTPLASSPDACGRSYLRTLKMVFPPIGFVFAFLFITGCANAGVALAIVAISFPDISHAVSVLSTVALAICGPAALVCDMALTYFILWLIVCELWHLGVQQAIFAVGLRLSASVPAAALALLASMGLEIWIITECVIDGAIGWFGGIGPGAIAMVISLCWLLCALIGCSQKLAEQAKSTPAAF